MRELYNADYYTLELIPKHRQEYISVRLNWFIDLMGLKKSHWPLDCIKLLDSLKSLGYFKLAYELMELPEAFDGQTKYYPEHDLYTIAINKNKGSYPFESSQDRRLNFTAAHELGHLVLGHALISEDKKTKEEKTLEDLEADEFAGRLLMPGSLIFNMNYYSLSSAAEYLLVSKRALKTRLNNLKRLNLLHKAPIRTCSNCGNTKFSIFSEYCGICGQPLKNNLKGIRQVFYPSIIKSDSYARAAECPLCKIGRIQGDKCQLCGTYIFNYCTDYLPDSNEGCSYAGPLHFRYCEQCGKPTHYNKRGLLTPWEEELEVKLDYP